MRDGIIEDKRTLSQASTRRMYFVHPSLTYQSLVKHRIFLMLNQKATVEA